MILSHILPKWIKKVYIWYVFDQTPKRSKRTKKETLNTTYLVVVEQNGNKDRKPGINFQCDHKMYV